MSAASTRPGHAQRERLYGRAVRLEWFTVGWNVGVDSTSEQDS